MKKKLWVLIPAMFLTLSLGACGGNDDEGGDSGDGQQQNNNDGGNQNNNDSGNNNNTDGGNNNNDSGNNDNTPASTAIVEEGFETAAWGVQIGQNKYVLAEDPTAQNVQAFADRQAAYVKHGVAVEAGQDLIFYKAGTAYTSFVNGSGDDTANGTFNNFVGTTATGFKIQTTATSTDIYLNLWKANGAGEEWITFWIPSGANGNHTDVVTPTNPGDAVTYTVTGMPEWVTNNGCVIFAWAWPSGSEGAWYSLTYGEGEKPTSATFSTPTEIAGFLLARCVAGTTEPNWNLKSGNDSGRIYNQTEDIAVTSGTTSYTCSAWKDYPKS